jgi:Flp pilus assembly protein TadG
MVCRYRRRRTGAAAVEFAFVVSIFLMVTFGILEYCRYFFAMDVLNNAAREGARYAVVNTNNGVTLYDVQNYVNNYLAGVGAGQLKNFTVNGNNGTIGTAGVANIQCYRVNPATSAPASTWLVTSSVNQGSGTGSGQSLKTMTNDWTNAAYGTPIAVQITGVYQPILPVLLLMPSPLTISVECVMYSEGN